MAIRDDFEVVASQVRTVVQRFALGLLVIASFGAMLVGKADSFAEALTHERLRHRERCQRREYRRAVCPASLNAPPEWRVGRISSWEIRPVAVA